MSTESLKLCLLRAMDANNLFAQTPSHVRVLAAEILADAANKHRAGPEHEPKLHFSNCSIYDESGLEIPNGKCDCGGAIHQDVPLFVQRFEEAQQQPAPDTAEQEPREVQDAVAKAVEFHLGVRCVTPVADAIAKAVIVAMHSTLAGDATDREAVDAGSEGLNTSPAPATRQPVEPTDEDLVQGLVPHMTMVAHEFDVDALGMGNLDRLMTDALKAILPLLHHLRERQSERESRYPGEGIVTMAYLLKIIGDACIEANGLLTWEQGLQAIRKVCDIEHKREDNARRGSDDR